MSIQGWRRLERVLVGLVILHTLAVGVLLLFLTRWGTTFGGWTTVEPLFFPRQAGVFHLLLGLGYALEYRDRRGVRLLVAAKFTAVVFLFGMMLFEEVPWAVPLSGVADGLMGLAVLLVRAGVRRAR